MTTLSIDGLKFDRQTISDLGDAIDDLIWDRFGDTFYEIGLNAIGERPETETEEDYAERAMEAMSTAHYLALKSMFGETDQFETK